MSTRRYFKSPTSGEVFSLPDSMLNGGGAPNGSVEVVVINPESVADVKALIKAARAHGYQFFPGRGNMQAALRSLLPPPPKPDEPTGLGAVVEDEDGRRWVRTTAANPIVPWKPVDAGGSWESWDDLPAAVKVLSEGVTP